MEIAGIIFKVFIVALTLYLMTGFILNKICELKNDRWHNFTYFKPSDDKKYLIVTKDMEIEVAKYEPKDFEFKGYDVLSWRELPLTNDVIERIQKNPFGFGRKKKNDK